MITLTHSLYPEHPDKKKTPLVFPETIQREVEAGPNCLSRIISHAQSVTVICQELWDDFLLNDIEILKKYSMTCNHCRCGEQRGREDSKHGKDLTYIVGSEDGQRGIEGRECGHLYMLGMSGRWHLGTTGDFSPKITRN